MLKRLSRRASDGPCLCVACFYRWGQYSVHMYTIQGRSLSQSAANNLAATHTWSSNQRSAIIAGGDLIRTNIRTYE